MEDEKIREQERIQRAFKAFQDAARNRSTDPTTFEAARTRYYALTKGPAWVDREKERIRSEKLDPIVADYRDQYVSLENEAKVQSAYTDSIAAIREKQDILKDSTNRQNSYFKKLLETQKAEKSAFDRAVELTQPSSAPAEDVTTEAPLFVRYFAEYPSSFTIVLDILLGVLIFFILFIAIRKTRISFRTGLTSFFTPQPQGLFIPTTPAFNARTPLLTPFRSATITPR